MLSPSGRTASKSGPSAAQLLATAAPVTFSSPASYLTTLPFTLSCFQLLPFYHFLIVAHPDCRAKTMSFPSVYASSRQPAGLLLAHEAGTSKQRHKTQIPRLIPAGRFPSLRHPPDVVGLFMPLVSQNPSTKQLYSCGAWLVELVVQCCSLSWPHHPLLRQKCWAQTQGLMLDQQ